MVIIAAAANEVLEPTASATAFAGHQRVVAQTAFPKRGVKFAVAQVVGVQDVESAAGEVMKEFPEFGGERYVGEFGGSS